MTADDQDRSSGDFTARSGALLVGGPLAELVRDAPRSIGPVQFIETLRLDHLATVPRGFRVLVVALAGLPPEARGDYPAELIGRVRRRRLAECLLAFVPAGARRELTTLPDLVRAGLDGVVIEGIEDFWPCVERHVGRSAWRFPARVEQVLQRASLATRTECLWVWERRAKGVTLTEVAGRSAVSLATLQRRYRRELGVSPAAWIRYCRLMAVLRLRQLGASNADIATVLGISEATHVSRLVRRLRNGVAITRLGWLAGVVSSRA